MQGTIDGENGDHILIAPPFIINGTEINEISEKLKITINSVCNFWFDEFKYNLYFE